MKTVTVELKERQNGTFILTFDGAPLGDTAGMTEAAARAAAQAKDGVVDGAWSGSVWVAHTFEFRA
tara:strand:+ start:1128 stop:1325 length:198 start_codon:yes stop_codon:yes gene_type:complete